MEEGKGKTNAEQGRCKPSVRFPEFEGEWKKKKLGEVAEKINSGKTPLGGESVYTDSGVLFIRSQNVNNDQLELQNSTFIPIEINNSMKNSIVKANDILLNITGASLGRSCVVPENFETGNVNQHVCIIRVNKENNPRFIQPIFSSSRGQNIFNSLQTGSGREGLNFESIKGFSLYLPSHPEQQKIASFFTAIDQKIHSLKKKKTLLEQYKKAIMQKIFSQEIRFKQDDGQDFPEWEIESFGNIYSFLSTNSLSRDNLTYDTGEVKNIHYGDIHTKFKCQFKVENELVPYVKYDITISRYNEEKYCKAGDLIFADASEDYDDIGKAIEIVSTNAEKILSGLHTIHARPVSNRMQVGFAAYLMQSSFIRREIMRISQGTKVLSISATRLKDVLIKVPHKEEQLKIANLLAALDLKIESLDSQIVGMESWKKGLLQQMFC